MPYTSYTASRVQRPVRPALRFIRSLAAALPPADAAGPVWEPEPEDWQIVCPASGPYQVGQIGGRYLGAYEEWEDAAAAVRDAMARQQFYPNCWFVDDHGGMELVSLTDG